MAILYKLTDRDGYTRRGMYNECKWSENITHRASEAGAKLCTAQVIHAYRSPLLAIFMNNLHANIEYPLLWKCIGDIVAEYCTKAGVKKLTAVRQIPVPTVSIIQRVAFGILAAKEVQTNAEWHLWADAWLSGKDRSWAAADAACALRCTTPVPRMLLGAAWAPIAAMRASKAACAGTPWAAAYAAAWAAEDAQDAANKKLDLSRIAEAAMLVE